MGRLRTGQRATSESPVISIEKKQREEINGIYSPRADPVLVEDNLCVRV